MNEENKEPTVRTRTVKPQSNARIASQLVVELAGIALCGYLVHEYHDHIEVAYASIGLVAGILGIRLKNPGSIGPIGAAIASLSTLTGNHRA